MYVLMGHNISEVYFYEVFYVTNICSGAYNISYHDEAVMLIFNAQYQCFFVYMHYHI
jgi:hypothetical protein